MFLFYYFQGRGVMPDGTTRFKCKGQELFHFMGCSTFSEYTVVSELSLCKVSRPRSSEFSAEYIRLIRTRNIHTDKS